jgi:ERCC4-related helicase
MQIHQGRCFGKNLKHIYNNVNTHKILIFANYHETFDKIMHNVTRSNLKCVRLLVPPFVISNTIGKFRNGKINVLMIDSQCYGSGIDLH